MANVLAWSNKQKKIRPANVPEEHTPTNWLERRMASSIFSLTGRIATKSHGSNHKIIINSILADPEFREKEKVYWHSWQMPSRFH